MQTDFSKIDPREFIIIKGARVNNLKNLSVAIPRNKLVVITGLSGSGKSSLAFDTLFAEGQRKYVESLSAYARQFLGRMEKPEVDFIKGLSPAISIEQKVNTRNPRSTIGTTTEIYDYLRLLFARVGKTISPISGKEVKKDSVTDVVDFILSHEEGTKLTISFEFKMGRGQRIEQTLKILLSKGYTRLVVDEQTLFIDDVIHRELKIENFEILIDRVIVRKDEETKFRLSDSVQTAFFEGEGKCIVRMVGGTPKIFSSLFEADGMRFTEPSINFFTFNNPYGACRRCEGLGRVLSIDPDRVIVDRNLSIYEEAIVPWRTKTMKKWLEPLLTNAADWDFPIHRPVAELNEKEYEMLWNGNGKFKGIHTYFRFLESKVHKIQYRVLLARYRGKTTCLDCKGTKLRKDASYVKVSNKSITDLVLMPVDQLAGFVSKLQLTAFDEKIASRILQEICNRLQYLEKVGLGYLTLNRQTSTLSGGEFQRIKLATSLGSTLVGSMYILDEPSIGLHPRDTDRLIEVLEMLRDMGNTVIVVEHEEKIMEAADQIIDIGPDAGIHGGELVFQGKKSQLNGQTNSYTAKYLQGIESILVPTKRRVFNQQLTIKGARENNLKCINVEIPMGVMTVVTGVSGSGKSTLIRKILYPALGKILGVTRETTGKFDSIEGDYSKVTQIELIDQHPIGKSSRSNPVTYVKAYDGIRQLFAELPLSKKHGFKPKHFSFNVDGGRCENCEGEGTVKIEMQFMADLHLTCEICMGKRFKNEILAVTHKHKNIADILDLSVEEAIIFFDEQSIIKSRLQPLFDVGLGYIKLGQSSNTLSGGEAQRVKLASFLGKNSSAGEEGHILFIFDEPTTGLHFHDIKKLLDAMNGLIDQGNSVLIIEHNAEVIKNADWIIDLGPEGGETGGNICFTGTPEEMVKLKENYTGEYLKKKVPLI